MNHDSLAATLASAVHELDPEPCRRANDRHVEARIVELQQELEALRQERDQLRDLAFRDVLTGLGNRQFLMSRLSHEISRTQADESYTFSLLLVDLDGFKAINDTWGHAAGDDALCEVADFLRDEIRRHDACVRLGGDEFVVLLCGADVRGRAAVIARLTRALERHNAQDDRRAFEIRMSIGGATMGADGDDMAALLEAADQAMYRDKRRHKRAS